MAGSRWSRNRKRPARISARTTTAHRVEDQAHRHGEHEQVALDGEVAQQANQADDDPDACLARGGIHVRPAAREQYDLRDQ